MERLNRLDRKIEQKQQSLKEEITEELAFIVNEEPKEEFDYKKLKTQLMEALIELEDLRNRSMRSTLILNQKPNETCEDNSKILAEFLASEVNLPYTCEEIDMQISRAHRGTERDITQNNTRERGPKPIFSQFVSWRVAEEVQNKVIHLNTWRKVNVVASQVFSKELTERRNGALKYRREYITNNQSVQIKLGYPATLKSRQKGSRGKWETSKEF